MHPTVGLVAVALAIGGAACLALAGTWSPAEPAVSLAVLAVAVMAAAAVLGLAWRAGHAEAGRHVHGGALEGLPVAAARVGPGGRVLEANEAFARTLGHASVAAVFAAPVEWLSAILDGPAGAEDVAGGERELPGRDGAPAWVRYDARAVRDREGRVRWHEVVIRDITDERACRDRSNLLESIVGGADHAVMAQALDGRVLSWNAAAERIYGWAAADIIGRSIDLILPQEDRDAHHEVLARVANGETVGPWDVRRRARDGRQLIVSLVVAPARDADGRIVAAAAIGRDATEEHRLRTEGAALEERLRQTHKLEAIGRLAGGIVHDFSNHLTTIQGYGSMVASGLTGAALEDQRRVLAAADAAAGLTRQLLQFAREAPADPRPLALDDAVEASLEMLRRVTPDNVVVVPSLASGAVVLLDRVELEQVLLNLVANAAEAMPGGGVVTISTAPTDITPRAAARRPGLVPGPYALLRVADTGRGMDEVTRARALDAFFTTKVTKEGAGLGLTSVSRIAQRARARVDIESAPGEGTVVSILVPLAEEADVAADPPARRYVPPGRERILVVEDDPAVRELAARVLQRARYEVTIADGPTQALELARAERFDAVVSDVLMPAMTGADLVERLPGHLPVVFISGYPGDTMPALGLDRPTRTFVPKPFEPVTLAAALRGVLDAAAAS